MKTQLQSLKLAGITKEEVINCVNEVFNEAFADEYKGGQLND